MNQRPDHRQAGRQLLELQLAMMKGAMTLMADSAQRIAELGFRAAASATGGAAARRQGPAAPAPASSAPHRRRETPRPSRAADRLSGKDYALRMQEDLDSILHAFAMVPDTADRLIRTSALLTEKPGKETAARERRLAKPLPAPARRPARGEAGEHAR
ncbi:MAG TPA: hypothetical protein VGE20_00965 [Ramlibacter sp.]